MSLQLLTARPRRATLIADGIGAVSRHERPVGRYEPHAGADPGGGMSCPALARTKRSLLVAMALGGLVAAACGGPATPALTDPKLILQAGIAGLQVARTFHLDGTATGRIVLGLGGAAGSGSGAPIVLDGSTITGDGDLAGKRASLSVAIPALFNVTADVVAVDGAVYARMPLFGSGGWTREAPTGSVFGALSDPAALLDGVAAFLGQPGVAPRTLSNERCDDADCYAVAFTIPAPQVASDASPGTGLPGGLVLGDIAVTALVRVNAPTLAKLSFDVPLGAGGTVNVGLSFSKLGDPVTITAPPGA
jgi:hypothetical protein